MNERAMDMLVRACGRHGSYKGLSESAVARGDMGAARAGREAELTEWGRWWGMLEAVSLYEGTTMQETLEAVLRRTSEA